MKTNNKVLLICTYILLLNFLTACKEEPMKELEYPLNGPIPQSDIVFMSDADPIHSDIDSKTLGFINADGSNRQEYTFKLVDGALSNFGYQMPSQYASHPRWSMDGDEIVFSIRGLPPNKRLIAQDGKMYGQSCLDVRRGATFDLRGNIFILITHKSPLYEAYKDIAETGLIARYDLKACEVVEVFSVPVKNITSSTVQESENGLLVAGFWNSEAGTDNILVYDQRTGKYQIFRGYHPSLTKDGAILAYYSTSGMLVIRDTATGEERNLISVFSEYGYVSLPGWSPDNQWLVYNTDKGEIFKINIDTRETVYLTYGWLPDWR